MDTGELDLWIFDADGTLRRTTVPGQPCPRKPGEWELLPGVRARVAELRRARGAGLHLGIASNQDQVGYGLLTEATARDLLRALAVAAFGVELPAEVVRLCPHRPEEGCECRKPRGGMLREIVRHYGVAPSRTVFVGDTDDDRRAALAAGVRFLHAGRWLSSTGAPSGSRTRRTPPPASAGCCDGGAGHTTRE